MSFLSACTTVVDIPTVEIDTPVDEDDNPIDSSALFIDPLADGTVADSGDCPDGTTAVSALTYVTQEQYANISKQVEAMAVDSANLVYKDDIVENMALVLLKPPASANEMMAAKLSSSPLVAKELFREILGDAYLLTLVKDPTDLQAVASGYVCVPTEESLLPCDINAVIEFLMMIQNNGGVCGDAEANKLAALQLTDCADIGMWEEYYNIYCNGATQENCDIYIAEMRLFASRGDCMIALTVYDRRKDLCTEEEVIEMQTIMTNSFPSVPL